MALGRRVSKDVAERYAADERLAATYRERLAAAAEAESALRAAETEGRPAEELRALSVNCVPRIRGNRQAVGGIPGGVLRRRWVSGRERAPPRHLGAWSARRPWLLAGDVSWVSWTGGGCRGGRARRPADGVRGSGRAAAHGNAGGAAVVTARRRRCAPQRFTETFSYPSASFLGTCARRRRSRAGIG
ncbi:hypothetical protein Arub01_22710 [Actinomadura rubrobrunea]|uniref:Uncharacterized protein n=1 Tax=Actinomadura rubrobrunea TaxID=115335 RepID=A0A9W6PUU4_9ACTN|nr:hypothetical protein Arub01_22710 [Actinomadura rubrobrunea]